MFLPPQIRIACKCLVVHRTNRPLLVRRDLSTSPRPQAAENRDSLISQFNDSPLRRQLADKPEALSALHEFVTLLKESGVELSSSSPPSGMQMIKLMRNSKFRDGVKRVIEEMRKAGVDINSQNAFELFTGRKPPGT